MMERVIQPMLRALSDVILSFSSYGLFHRFKNHEDEHQVPSPYSLTRKDWKIVLKDTVDALFNKRLLTLSGGVAFYATLAIIPLLAAGLAILGLIVGSDESSRAIHVISSYLPEEFSRFLNNELSQLATTKSANIITVLVAVGIGLWTASAAIDNLIQALNAVYDQKEDRRLGRFKLISFCLVLVVTATFASILPLLLIDRHTLEANGVGPILTTLFPYLRWFFILVIISSALALIYRYAPNKGKLHWRWISWGATTAALLWLLGTYLFFVYVQYIADFSQAYGVLAGMFVLMAWVEMSSHILIIGAYVNYKLQNQAIIKEKNS